MGQTVFILCGGVIKRMHPLGGASKIHSSWMEIAKMLTNVYWLSVTPLA